MAKSTKTTRLQKALKRSEPEIRVPIATDMYIPNHSGIASHKEAQGAFVNKTGDTMSGDLVLDAANLRAIGDLNLFSGNQTARGLKITEDGSDVIFTTTGGGAVEFKFDDNITITKNVTAINLFSNTTSTALSPNYSFTNDTNTGMFSSQADACQIAAGGLEFYRAINSGQNINIFNINNEDIDFRIYGITNNDIFTVDASTENTAATGTFTAAKLVTSGAATASTPQFTFSADTNTGVLRLINDSLSIAAGGIEMYRATEAVNNINIFNPGNLDVDFRIASDTITTAFFVDGADGVITLGQMSSAGFLKNTAFGVLSGGNSIDLTADVTGDLPIAEGGTGASTATDGFDALAPTTTKGDLTVHDGTDNIRLPIAQDDKILIADSAQTSGMRWDSIPSANVNKEIFYPPTSFSAEGEVEIEGTAIDGAIMSSSGFFRLNFYIPTEAASNISMHVVVVPDATETLQWDALGSHAAVGQLVTQGEDTLINSTLAVTDNTLALLAVTSAFTNASAGDYCGLEFQSDTGNIRAIGFLLKYTT